MMMLRKLVCIALGVAVATAGSAMAATPEQVADSIRKGREWLLSAQQRGNWEKEQKPEAGGSPHHTEAGQWGGMTALATYALLAAGESPNDPKMQEAIKFLRDADIKGVYALGMRAQVWDLVPKADWVQECIDRDAKLLLDGVLQEIDNTGLYNYLTPARKGDTRVDHSVSQYGVLGTWALNRSGADIPPRYWDLVEKVWVNHQDISGGWCYDRRASDGHPISMAMTAAGVATLFITQDYLHADEGIQPRGNITRPEIELGLKWMSDNFDSIGSNWYAWYGVERIGVASGRKYFGTNNWYEKGADRIVKAQGAQGQWSGGGGTRADVTGTSFCLVFLSRGRAPIMMSKLEYQVVDPKGKSAEGLWNQRPRDVANLTRWVGQRIERDLNWQVVNLDAPATELAEAPILYMSGSAPVVLSDAHKTKLKQYIEHGGMVLGNADAGKVVFTESMKKMGESMFPGQKFRELPDKHPIYNNQQFQRSRWKFKPPVQALSNGARELMVIIPQVDPARQWQTNDDRKREESFQLPANIFLYAVDKTMQFKGERVVPKPDPKIATERAISVARLDYGGNWDPEPAGWQRLQAIMRNTRKVDLKTTPVKLGEGALTATFNVAHLTGTEDVKFTQKQRDELKDYVAKGGTLLIDAAGGKSDFRAAIENELVIIFGQDVAKAVTASLKPDNPLYTAMGEAATNVEYRTFAKSEVGKSKDPRFRAIEAGGRYGVIYSPQDMSVGLVGTPVDGIMGYSPKSATDLMAAVLSYATK